MFGNNPISKKASLYTSDGTLFVKEIFHTIQGEGPFAGEAAIFLRLGGCNLRCWFCDTDFDLSSSLQRSAADVMATIVQKASLNGLPPLIVITGGEPLLQNLYPLLQLLADWGVATVQIETAGTVENEALMRFAVYRPACAFSSDHAPFLTLVCSPKTPTVKEQIVDRCVHWKYIIDAEDSFDPETGLPLATTQTDILGASPRPLYVPSKENPGHIWVQPAYRYHRGADGAYNLAAPDEKRNEKNRLRCASLCMTHGYRLSLQQHKILNLP